MSKQMCMNTSCSGTTAGTRGAEATLAFRLRFVFNRRGFPPKHSVAWVGVYVCSTCATKEAADEIMKSAWNLGEMIRTGINADTLVIEKTTWGWEPLEGATKFFKPVEDKEAEVLAAHRSSIVDSAKDNIQ